MIGRMSRLNDIFSLAVTILNGHANKISIHRKKLERLGATCMDSLF